VVRAETRDDARRNVLICFMIIFGAAWIGAYALAGWRLH
jgi:hypothetical protein